jgi:predicted nucleic acid-binding protein
MSHVLDTSILVRLTNKDDVQHGIAARSIVELHRRGITVHLAPQSLIEFRSVATRPRSVNGLGFSAQNATTEAARFLAVFPLLDETPAVFTAWKSIVELLGVTGKQVHDARLAAVCQVSGMTHLLTFNIAHFGRFSSCGPPLTIVDPTTL